MAGFKPGKRSSTDNGGIVSSYTHYCNRINEINAYKVGGFRGFEVRPMAKQGSMRAIRTRRPMASASLFLLER